MQVALVHDYLTQRGGAERVVLSLTRAFPDAPVYTSLYDPGGTFPEFGDIDVRTMPINRIPPLRRYHRAALPLLAPSFSQLRISADVVICSSSGWAHGTRVKGRKIVYCHTPARWLYQPDRYLRGRGRAIHAVAGAVRLPLALWDQRAAASADAYLANSTVVAERIKSLYGIDADVVPPPPAVMPDGPARPIPGIEPGFVLTVSRLLPYKNVDAVIKAFQTLPDERLIVVGSGPAEGELGERSPANVRLVGSVDDDELRWLYANCRALVAASYEDFGLTPVEAAGFGKPTAALRFGGYIDTVVEGETGSFFASPSATEIAEVVRSVLEARWEASAIRNAADRLSEARFIHDMTERAR
jgi:glycosyltransferase involved in cell wall biosynthesis